MALYASGSYYLSLSKLLPVSGISKCSIAGLFQVIGGTGYTAGSTTTFSVVGVPAPGNFSSILEPNSIVSYFLSPDPPFSNPEYDVPYNNLTTYFFALLYDATGYPTLFVNNSPYTLSKTWATGQPFTNANVLQIGLNATAAALQWSTQILYQDIAFWSGYILTSNDMYNLMARNVTPLQVGPSATLWYPLSNTSGTIRLNPPDSGLINWGTAGTGYNLNTQTFLAGSTGYWYNQTLSVFGNNYISNAYVNQSSGLVTFIFKTLTTNQYSFNPTVTTHPTLTITRGASTTTLPLSAARSGMYTSPNVPWIMYNISPSTILPTDTVTYSAPSGWVNTNDGFINSSTGYLTNYAGQNIWTINPSSNVQIGMCIQRQFGSTFAHKNLRFQMGYLSNVSGTTSDQYPLAITGGGGSATFMYPPTNIVNSSPLPIWTGVYTIIYKDDPTFSSLLTLIPFPNSNIVVTNTYFNSTVMTGVRYTRSQWSVSYASPTGNLSSAIKFNWFPMLATGIFVKDLWIIPPGNSLDTSDIYAIDQNFLSQLSTTSGKFCPLFRIATYDDITNFNPWIDTQDYINPTGFSYLPTVITLPVKYLLPYNISTSSGVQLPITQQLTYPSSTNWLWNAAGAFNKYFIEVVCTDSGSYNFRTGMPINITNTSQGNFNVTDGTYTWSVSLLSNSQNVFVTSPSSFVMVCLSSALSGNVQTLVSPVIPTGCTFTVNNNYGSPTAPPYETAFAIASKFSGATLLIDTQVHHTDRFITQIAQSAFNILSSGQKMLIQLSNEHWNNFYPIWTYLFSWKALVNSTSDALYTTRLLQHAQIFDAVWTSGGRPNSIIAFLGSQYGGDPTTILNVAQSLNPTIPLALAVAPYMGVSTATTITGAATYWTLDKYHDLYRHYVYYNKVDAASLQSTLNQVNAYKSSTGTGIAIYGYEFGNLNATYKGVENVKYVATDFHYHPESYNTTIMLYNLLDKYGYAGAFHSSFNGYLQLGSNLSPADFSVITWPMQKWGYGNNNQFTLSDHVPRDAVNDSTILQAWKDFTNVATGVKTYDVKPVVLSVNPANHANVTGVPSIAVTFNKAMDSNNVFMTLKTISNSSIPVSYSSIDPFNFTITPSSNLSANTEYVLTVSGSVDTVGITQNQAFQSTFNDAQFIPIIVSYSPATGSPVNINSNIFAVFNTNVQSGTILMSVVDSGGAILPGNVTYNSGTFKATFNYTPPLTFSDTYTVGVSGAANFNNLVMSPSSWQFTTPNQPAITQLVPLNNSTNNPITAAIYAVFNENVSSGSIAFTLKDQFGSNIPGNVTYANDQANFNLQYGLSLAISRTYTATITGVTDSFGNLIPSTGWSFTTGVNAGKIYNVQIPNSRQYNNIEIILE